VSLGGLFPGRHHVSEEIDMTAIEHPNHASRPTRREFPREALRSLTAVALIEGLATHRLLGKDVQPIIDAWFHEPSGAATGIASKTTKTTT